MWALSCSFPNLSTRENLINLFEEIRIKDIEEIKLESNLPTSQNIQKQKIETVEDKRFTKFFRCFCRVQNILYTRIGIDELDRL